MLGEAVLVVLVLEPENLLAWDSRITTEASEGRSFDKHLDREGRIVDQRNSPRSGFCVVKHENLRNSEARPKPRFLGRSDKFR